MSLGELDLPTVLFGFITAFSTAVAYMYKDMRKDFQVMQEQAAKDREKCDMDKHELLQMIAGLREKLDEHERKPNA